MAVSESLRNRAHLTTPLTPGIRVGMELLRLSPQELAARITAEAAANPLLVLQPAPNQDSAWPFRSERNADANLSHHLRIQLGHQGLPPNVLALAQAVVDLLDKRGFLSPSRAEVSVIFGQPLATVDAALAALRTCDPAGVGAFDTKDCYGLQLLRDGLHPDTCRDVLAALEPLLTEDWPRARRLLNRSQAELEALAQRLKRLNPDPARTFRSTKSPALVPDILVERQAQRTFVVSQVDTWMPRLSIDRVLRAHSQENASNRAQVEAQVRSAESLIRAIKFRARTLERLGQYLTKAQESFFLGDSDLPRPLSRSQAASDLRVHASTVGRALRGRALAFEGRVIELDWFFPKPLPVEDGGTISILEVQALLRDMVAAEPPHAPLSDSDLVARLHQEGVDIARRTVAKYRDAMSIPPSHIRRKQAPGPLRRT